MLNLWFLIYVSLIKKIPDPVSRTIIALASSTVTSKDNASTTFATRTGQSSSELSPERSVNGLILRPDRYF